jgi:hypothetical protein
MMPMLLMYGSQNLHRICAEYKKKFLQCLEWNPSLPFHSYTAVLTETGYMRSLTKYRNKSLRNIDEKITLKYCFSTLATWSVDAVTELRLWGGELKPAVIFLE